MKRLSMPEMKSASPGFTIIELLVVIIIMGVLAAIALPSYLNFRSRVASREAMLLLSSLMKEEQAHFVEHSDWSDEIVGTLPTPDLSEYEVVIDTFNNHQTLDGERVSGLRLRAIPQKDSLLYVMGKVWVADNDVKTVLCDSEKDTPFMNSRTYCPDS